MNKTTSRTHRGLISLYAIGMVVFFSTAIVLSIIIINAGFMVTDTEKQVVLKALEKADDHLIIAGKITGTSDEGSNELSALSTPIRTASAGAVKVDEQTVDVSFRLEKFHNNTITYNNIYTGNLYNHTFNSMVNAIAEAKNQGLIDYDPYVDKRSPSNTTAFIYWIINDNFDERIDEIELAAFTIVYSENDRPTSGEFLYVQANVERGYILKMDHVIPPLSSSIINFGGKIKDFN